MFLGEDTTQAADYYGPPRPGQSFAQYESYMKLPIAAGVGIAAAMMINPVIGIAAGAATWLLSGSGDHSNKPTSQGG